jgi:hypothetical protein
MCLMNETGKYTSISWLHFVKPQRNKSGTDNFHRVYGALGLLTSPSIRFFTALPTHLELLCAFPIQYNKSVSTVFQDVIKYLIQRTGSLEVLDVLTDRTYLEHSEFPSWATDWGREREELECSWFRSQLLTYPENMDDIWCQKDTPVGYLRVKGTRIASCMVSLNSDHTIKHQSKPNWTTFKDLVHSYYDKTGANKNGYRAIWGSYGWIFIFPTLLQIDGTWIHQPQEVEPKDVPIQFAQYLSGRHYVTATFRNSLEPHRISYHDVKHYLVPRNACLDDIVVVLYGSSLYHLLRPCADRVGYYRYLGPVTGIQILPPQRDTSDAVAFIRPRQEIAISSDSKEEQFMLL